MFRQLTSMKMIIIRSRLSWFLILTKPLLIFGQGSFDPNYVGFGFCNSDRDCVNPWHGCVPDEHFYRNLKGYIV